MKHIDTEKLIAEIKGLQCEQGFEDGETERGYQFAIKDILGIITSLQQEQFDIIDSICTKAGIPAPYKDGNQWSILKGDNIQEGVVGFGDTKMDALVSFLKDIPIQQVQPDVDFEKAIKEEMPPMTDDEELGKVLNARKEDQK